MNSTEEKTTNETTRVALVGCGQIAQVHISALKRVPGAQLCAVVDRDGWRAREIAQLAGDVAAYNNYSEMLNTEQPDTVHVLTPPATHAALAIQAMEAGCSVLVEKPMAMTVGQAQEMIAAAQANGVVLCTNHNYLFKPSVMRARELVNSGAIGDVVHVDTYYGLSEKWSGYSTASGRSHWSWRLPGGAFEDLLPHVVYLQLAFLPGQASLQGLSISQNGSDSHPPTEMTALLQGCGATGSAVISMRARPYAKSVTVYGTKGTVQADLVRETCVVHMDRQLPGMLSKPLYNLEESLQLATGTLKSVFSVTTGRLPSYPGLHRVVQQFYASLRYGTPLPVDAAEGQRMVEVLETIRSRSAHHSPANPVLPERAVATGPLTKAENKFTAEHDGKVLVTGANGFLGHRLVAALHRCGCETVALVRDPNRAPLEMESQAEIVTGDIRDARSLRAAMEGVGTVFHCAAIATNKASWTIHQETNINGTRAVLEAARDAGVRRVVHVSSIAVYGLDHTHSDGPIDENCPYPSEPDKWAHYMRSKMGADRLALEHAGSGNLQVTVVRPGILYGPGGGKGIGTGRAQLGKLHVSIGSGRNRLPYTYVDNCVDCLLLAAISAGAPGQAFNIVDDPQVGSREIAALRSEITGEQASRLSIPTGVFMALARLMEWRRNQSGSEYPPGLTRYVLKSSTADIVYSADKAREELGWRQEVSLEEGLRRTLEN